MAYKQSVQANKNWNGTGGVAFAPTNIVAKLWNLLKLEIPVGYQDEAGFHYGTKSVAKIRK